MSFATNAFTRAAAVVSLAVGLGACSSMNPYQGQQVGTGIGMGTGAVLGGVLGNAMGGRNGGLGAVVGAGLGAAIGAQIGGPIGSGIVSDRGQCSIRRTVVIQNGYPMETTYQDCAQTGPYTRNQPYPGQY